MDVIRYWDRKKGSEETEEVYGDQALRWVYENPVGRTVADPFLVHPMTSKLYGFFQSSPLSAPQIAPFVEKFKIKMEEFEPGPFSSFNSFFIRKFKPGFRTFVKESRELPAFAEARYFAYDRVDMNQGIPVKGKTVPVATLLSSPDSGSSKSKPQKDWIQEFENGPLLLARLCPVDYHRFHFPDAGRLIDGYSIPGKLHSVNPLALKNRPDIFITNERRVSILETRHFGLLAYVEVGALCVGKIVQTHPASEFQRGDEKGYFLFGGSTVIVLGQAGRWSPDADVLAQTAAGRETLIELGNRIAFAKN